MCAFSCSFETTSTGPSDAEGVSTRTRECVRCGARIKQVVRLLKSPKGDYRGRFAVINEVEL